MWRTPKDASGVAIQVMQQAEYVDFQKACQHVAENLSNQILCLPAL